MGTYNPLNERSISLRWFDLVTLDPAFVTDDTPKGTWHGTIPSEEATNANVRPEMPIVRR